MTFIIATFVILLGVTVFSFTVINSILVVFFALPLTRKLIKHKLLNSKNNVLRKYQNSFFVQLFILFTVTFIFYIFFTDSYFISLVIGYALSTFGLFGKYRDLGLTPTNLQEYLKSNKRFLSDELVQFYKEDRVSLFKYVQNL